MKTKAASKIWAASSLIWTQLSTAIGISHESDGEPPSKGYGLRDGPLTDSEEEVAKIITDDYSCSVLRWSVLGHARPARELLLPRKRVFRGAED